MSDSPADVSAGRLEALEQLVHEQRQKMDQLTELVQTVRAEVQNVRTEVNLLDREFTCFFRLMRVQLEANGLTEKCADIVSDFETVMHERLALLARPAADQDEPTDPGGKRRTLRPVE